MNAYFSNFLLNFIFKQLHKYKNNSASTYLNTKTRNTFSINLSIKLKKYFYFILFKDNPNNVIKAKA